MSYRSSHTAGRIDRAFASFKTAEERVNKARGALDEAQDELRYAEEQYFAAELWAGDLMNEWLKRCAELSTGEVEAKETIQA